VYRPYLVLAMTLQKQGRAAEAARSIDRRPHDLRPDVPKLDQANGISCMTCSSAGPFVARPSRSFSMRGFRAIRLLVHSHGGFAAHRYESLESARPFVGCDRSSSACNASPLTAMPRSEHEPQEWGSPDTHTHPYSERCGNRLVFSERTGDGFSPPLRASSDRRMALG